MSEFDDLEAKFARGEISYDELVERGNRAVERVEKRCAHSSTTTEDTDSGGWAEWCDDCGARVGGSGGARTVKAGGNGCAVVALLLLSGAVAAAYGVVEAVRHFT